MCTLYLVHHIVFEDTSSLPAILKISNISEMRRCQAPSQVALRFNVETSPAPPTPEQRSRKRKRVNYKEEEEAEQQQQPATPTRTPLSMMSNRAPMIGSCSPASSSVLSPHEALIRSTSFLYL